MNLSKCQSRWNGSFLNRSCECGSSPNLNECMWEIPYDGPAVGVVAFLYIVIFVLALWNIVVIAIFIKDRAMLQEPSSVFLLVLAVVDMLEAVLSIPFYVATLIGDGWIFGSTDAIRQGVCMGVGFVLSVFLLISVHLLALISFDRFLYIVFALRYRTWMNTKRAIFLTIVVSIIPIFLASTPLFGFGELGFSSSLGVCIFRWEGQREYVILIAAEALIPVVATIVFTLWAYIYVRRFLRRRYIRQASYGDSTESPADLTASTGKLERTLTRVFVLLLVSQAICFTPGILTAIIGFFVGYSNIPSVILLIDFVIIISNAAINPLIQSLVKSRIRRYLSMFFNALCCRCTHVFAGSSIDDSKETSVQMRDVSSKGTGVHVLCDVSQSQMESDACRQAYPESERTPSVLYNIDLIGGTLV